MLQNDPLMLPPFHSDAGPDPAFHFNADPDPASQIHAYPDLQHYPVYQKTFPLNKLPVSHETIA
jgi:hypothetical protein